MIDFNSPSYMLVDFNTPFFTRVEFNPKIYDKVNFNTPTFALIFQDLNIPQFLTDEEAIANLAPQQTYQLIGSRLVKVTPSNVPSLFTNIWVDLSKAFTYFRRIF